MTRHAIDDALLAAHEAGRSSGEQPSGRRIGIDDPYAQAKAILLTVIGEASHCRAVWSKRFGFSTVFGYAGDLMSVELLYTSLLLQARNAMVRAGDGGKRARSSSFRRSFLFGFADRIGRRLEEAAGAAVADAVDERGSALLPVLAQRSGRVDEFRNEAFPHLAENRMTIGDWSGWVSGVAAADTAVIARGPSTRGDGVCLTWNRESRQICGHISATQRAVSLSRMSLLGTRELGRGVVVGPGQETPGEWSGCPRVVVGEAELSEPGAVVQILQATWMERLPVVIELMAEPSSLRAPERSSAPVYSLSPRFEFTRERLQYLVWANNYDARSGELVWWHGRRAARFFAEQGVCVGGPADIVLSDGTPLFVDGGPFLPPVSVGGIGVVHRWNVEAGSLERLGDQAPSSELAPDQLAAVRHGVGGARVIAPAGSGKTRVLTERLRHLVRDLRVHRGVVTALAFNTKAAEEMRERCAELLGRGRATHPDAEQRGPVDLQRVRSGRTTPDHRRSRGPRSPPAAVRDPSAVQHRHRPPVHRRALEHSPRTRGSERWWRRRSPTRWASPRVSTATVRRWPTQAWSISTSRSTGR